MDVPLRRRARADDRLPRALSLLVVLALTGWVLTISGCRGGDGGGGASSGPQPSTDAAQSEPAARTLSGRVVSHPPPGDAGIERWRFQPDGQSDSYLRLTRAQMQESIPPDAKEIQLDRWAGKKIRVKYQRADDTWVWGAEVPEGQ